MANAIDEGLAMAAQRKAQHATTSDADRRIAARIQDPQNKPGVGPLLASLIF